MKQQKFVSAVFDLPEEFVKLYNLELRSWGLDFQRRGPNCLIALRRVPGMPVILDGNGQVTQRGVHLCAKVEQARRGSDEIRLRIHPESAEDLRTIMLHLEDVRRWGPPVATVGRPKDRPSIEVPG